ncbi:MAG: cytochrome P450 [Hydrococcus sp. RU_2_2]|nr:cytochrome P450 [Hydrococcus sp. RU_2_2]NJP21623.1 cytochrome P450 [Hydrococcus sp. CRU_1_1]
MSSHVNPLPVSEKIQAPGPDLFNSMKSLARITKEPLKLFNELHQQYGNVVCLNLGFNKMFVLNDAHHIKYILQKNIKNYQKLQRLERQTKLLFGEGWTHEINRQIIKPFFAPDNYTDMDNAIADATQKMLERWQTFANNRQPFDVAKEMMSLSLSFTTKTLIDRDFPKEQNDVAQAMETIIDRLNTRAMSNFNLPENIPTPANQKYLAAVRTLQTAIDQIIEQRQHQETDKIDLLSVLQSWRDEKTGKGLSPKLLRERLLWILLPAFEPLGRVLSWVWYLLSLNPHVENQMRSELESVLGDRPPTFNDLPNLRYTKMVVEETLRLYPPFWVMGREAIAPDEVGGFSIPAKSIVLFNIYGVHHNPTYWDNPESFDPDRFTPERSGKRPGAAFIPFSIGSRACLGYNLALMQIQLVVAMVARVFRLNVVPEHPVEPVAMVSLLPRHGIQVTASPRL